MAKRGKLIIYLGYAAGVGKTYAMLREAQRRRAEGADVVIGYFEPHDRPDTVAQTRGLELIPPKLVVYRGVEFREMDTEAVLARRPQLCVVDELAHTNVPGSARAKRWQDVELLRDHGIDVLSNLNVQHLESLNDQVQQISGVRVRETVPDWVVAQAEEVILVDLTPRALLHRLERGVVYPPERAQRALAHFFREGTLGGLRELALRQAAHVTEARQEEPAAAPAAGRDRVLIHVTADPESAMLIRRGKRVADFIRAACLAVHITAGEDTPNPEATAAVERHLAFARNLRIETHAISGGEMAEELVNFARRNRITQVFVLGPERRRDDDAGVELIRRLVRRARDMQITIVARRRTRPGSPHQ